MRILSKIMKSIIRLEKPNMSKKQFAAELDALASKRGGNLDWRGSIIDLMKALDIDSSLEHRRHLASELKYEGDFDGSPEQNAWLHSQIVRLVAEYEIDLPHS